MIIRMSLPVFPSEPNTSWLRCFDGLLTPEIDGFLRPSCSGFRGLSLASQSYIQNDPASCHSLRSLTARQTNLDEDGVALEPTSMGKRFGNLSLPGPSTDLRTFSLWELLLYSNLSPRIDRSTRMTEYM